MVLESNLKGQHFILRLLWVFLKIQIGLTVINREDTALLMHLLLLTILPELKVMLNYHFFRVPDLLSSTRSPIQCFQCCQCWYAGKTKSGKLQTPWDNIFLCDLFYFLHQITLLTIHYTTCNNYYRLHL